MFKKILIANRGEIAVRIIRAAKELGIKTVAVYSQADKFALHTRLAEESVFLGEPEPQKSYLNIGSILLAAEKTGAEAIHPGYGFLAENHLFAKACEEKGLVFIGPKSSVIQLMGDKVVSRKTMAKAGVPLVPALHVKNMSSTQMKEKIGSMGYPVLVKAAGGGGGKGMRVIREPSQLEESISAAQRESLSAFGDETVYLEKYVEKPRHVEFQVVADNRGNVVHLFERECSIQRRYQKIVEETPSVALDSQLRERMGNTALNVVKTSGYTNAGTVEFLLDQDCNFYFLEMNTRIQVEHPVTELVTGIDLVKLQISIAAGEPLSLKQEDIARQGHAIECRIYAEDPENNFFPSPGTILFLDEPQGPGIRVDSGIYSGWTVPVFYDPILSKLISWGETREYARKRMIEALSNYVVLGIKTTIPFLSDLMKHKEFINGNTNTNFLNEYMDNWVDPQDNYRDHALISAAIAEFQEKTMKTSFGYNISPGKNFDPWTTLGSWQIGD